MTTSATIDQGVGAPISSPSIGSVASPPTITVRRSKLPAKVLLSILIDATGSSRAFAIGILRTCELILRAVEARAAEVCCAVHIHRDEEYGEMPCTLLNGGTPAQALDEIGRIHFAGGGDASETHAAAVVRALDATAWIANRRVGHDVMIVMTTSETKPVTGIDFSAIGDRIKQRGILYYHVGEPTPNLQAITNAANGMTIPLSNTPDAGECSEVATKCAASIWATVSSGATVPMTVS